MPIERRKEKDYRPLSASPKKGGQPAQSGPAALDPPAIANTIAGVEQQSLVNLSYTYSGSTDPVTSASEAQVPDADAVAPGTDAVAAPVGRKQRKRQEQDIKDTLLLKDERWLVRNGHFLTFIGLYLFSIMVLFRPYELTAALGF